MSNYRPIQLATTIARLVDRLLAEHLARHYKIPDNQFGLRPGLYTESAILALKQTVH